MEETGKIPLLIEKAKKGDEKAFEEIVIFYYEKIFHLIYRIHPCREDAEEIAQDTFVRFWNVLKRIDSSLDPYPFIHSIAVRRTYSCLRWHRLRATTSLDDIEPIPVPSGIGLLSDFYRACKGLPAKQRICLVLSEVEGISNKEIAELLHISEVTTRRHLSIAKAKIKKSLSK